MLSETANIESAKERAAVVRKNAGVTSRDTTEIDSEIDIEVDGNKDKETVISKKQPLLMFSIC